MLTSKDYMSTLEELESWLLNEEMDIKTNGENEISKNPLIVHGKAHKNEVPKYNNHNFREKTSNGSRPQARR